MRSLSFWFAASALVAGGCLAPAPGLGAVVQRHDVTITVDPSTGKVTERAQLEVRLETSGDVETWSSYTIPLNDNRTLVKVSAHTLQPDGKREKVAKKDRDTLEVTTFGLHSSERFELISFPKPRVGSVVVLDYEVEEKPYFKAGQLSLTAGDHPIEHLRMEIATPGRELRWRIDGPADGYAVEESEGGLVVVAEGLDALDPPDFAPTGAPVWPLLRYAWDDEGSWEGVGTWYSGLLAQLPATDEAVKAEARRLVAGVEEPRAKLENIFGFLRSKVRYVAVEVGIGGFRPSPPPEVLERRWGDCKDKATLMIDMLREVGIEAYLVLIRAGRSGRIDVDFPSPYQFNHMIVAVPTTAVATTPTDPVGGEYLFVDPTQTRGSAGWLHPFDHDQSVLIVRDGRGVRARTPLVVANEERRLTVNLTVTPEGDAAGNAALELRGSAALGLLEQIESKPKERTEEDLRAIFGRYLPGARIGRVGWRATDGEVPEVAMAAELSLEGLVQGLGSAPSFRLQGPLAMPEARTLADREVPLVIGHETVVASWQITLPAGWCPPRTAEKAVENAVGSFVQVAREVGESTYLIERRSQLRRRWVEGEELAALRELAIEERRADQRRVRLECPAPSAEQAGAPASR